MRNDISTQKNIKQIIFECTKDAVIDTIPGFVQIGALSIKPVSKFLQSSSKWANGCKYGLNNIGIGLCVAIDAFRAGKEAVENFKTNKMTKWEATLEFFKDIAVSVALNVAAAAFGSLAITFTTSVMTTFTTATVLTGGLTLVPLIVGGVATAAFSFLGAFIWTKFKIRREYKNEYVKLCKQFGVKENSNDKEVKRAYHKLARQLHSDRNVNETDRQTKEDQFKEITTNFAKLAQLRVYFGKCNRKVNIDQTWLNRLIEYATRLWLAVNIFRGDERVERAMVQFEENFG